MVDLLHQGEQPAGFTGRKARAGKPVEVIARQVGDQAALVFAKGHDAGDEQFEVGGIHRLASQGVPAGAPPRSGARGAVQCRTLSAQLSR